MDLGSDADLFKWEKEADALEEDEAEVKDFGEDAEAEVEADRISADDDDDDNDVRLSCRRAVGP